MPARGITKQTILALVSCSAVGVTLSVVGIAVPWLVLGDFHFLGYRASATTAFLAVVAFRYWRTVVMVIGYLSYRPALPSATPKYTNADVTVILPTVEPWGMIFEKCCESVCLQRPAELIIAVSEHKLIEHAELLAQGLRKRFDVEIVVRASHYPGKRHQIAAVLKFVTTRITVLIDDHVFWGPKFLAAVLPAFENDNIALVGTSKRVIMDPSLTGVQRWMSFEGSAYLERHNVEIMASTTIDGGIFAVSGRTVAVRSSVLLDHEFQHEYLNETFGFASKRWGPLGADDDNFVTRWVVAKGLGVRIQANEDATIATILPADEVIETRVGNFPKFVLTCVRWARTTFRSNPRSLLMWQTWYYHPWSVYAVQLAWMINFALFWDALMVYLFSQTSAHQLDGWSLWWVVAGILSTKTIKLIPLFKREPRLIKFFPLHVIFAYIHSFIKLFAMITFYDVAWLGRKLPVEADQVPGEE